MVVKYNNLMDKIYWHWRHSKDITHFGMTDYRRALMAVAELHKPEQEIGGACDENGEELWICIHCPDGDGFQDYPCPTIQAIAKELN